MKTDLFQSCGHCWVFQICWNIACSTFTASTFRIWNRSTGIPLPPLALLVVMLSKAHFTSHSRMSGSRWVITPLWLSGSWRSFLYSSSVYSCHLFLISSASVRSIPFLFFIEPIFAWNAPLVSLIFLKRSLDFPILLFSSISLHWSLRKAFLSLLASLWNSAFKWEYLSFSPLLFTCLHFTAVCKASSDNHFAFLHFFSMGMVLKVAKPRLESKPLDSKVSVVFATQVGQIASAERAVLLSWESGWFWGGRKAQGRLVTLGKFPQINRKRREMCVCKLQTFWNLLPVS